VTKASTVHSAKRKFLFSTKSKKDKGMNGENSQMENTTSEIQSQSNEDVGFGMSLEGMALSLSLGSNLLKPPEELIASRELSMDKALRSCGRAVADHQAAMICLKLTAAQLATCNLELNSLRSLVNTVEKTQREKEDHHKKLVAEVESLKVQLQIANTKSNSSSQGITSTVRSLLGGQSTTTTDKPLSQSSNHRAKAPPPPQTPPPSNNNVLVRAGLGVCVPARGGASRVKPPQPLTMAANESDVIVLNEAKVWVSEAKDALDVAASLLAMMNEVIAACHPRSPVPLPFPNGDITSGGSQGWNQAVRSIGPQGFINARRMPSFQEICLDAAELQRVDMDKLLGRSRHGADDSSSDERSFYLSLLNLLTMHATIKFGGFNLGVITDAHGVSRKVGYHVGGEVLTLLDIKKRLDASVEFSF
jgi:hypothetical protein